MPAKILCVDDDPRLLAGLQRNLRKLFEVEIAESGELGLVAMNEKGPFAVILSDMGMPGMKGSEFLKEASVRAPDTVRVMLTGFNDQETAIKAVNDGCVFRFINKPCDPDILIQTLQAAVKQHALITAERELLEQTLNGSVKMVTDILGMADPLAFGRAKLLRDYAHEYLNACEHEDALPWEIELAAMLLSLGLITIPPSLLDKQSSGSELSEAEREIMGRVPETGYNLISNIPRLERVAQIVRFQDKNYDGSGAPAAKVKEREIPFGARLLKVLRDLIEKEASGQPRVGAIAALREHRGSYDPEILQNCGRFLKAEPSLELQGGQVTTVLIAELTNRHTLYSPLVTREGLVIAPKGTEISNLILQKIRNFGTLHTLVEPVQVTLRNQTVHL